MATMIREKDSNTLLARDETGSGVVSYEGNLYFEPGTVNHDVLRLTDRTYTCPHKGTCHWVDFVGPDGRTVKDVAWVYSDPKAGHEVIKDRYGFYSGSHGATREER